jgi:adenylylsulfate reductase subunit B
MPPVINKNKCINCHKCVEACAQDVFFGSVKKKTPSITYPDFCIHCSVCINECPAEGAIKLRIPMPLTLLYKD